MIAPMLRRVVGAVSLLMVTAPALSATLESRLSNVFGNFLVGAGPVGDSGSFSEFLTSLSVTYARAANDAGAVNGELDGQPVIGSASFATQAGYVFDPMLIVGDGSVTTTGDTPFDYVSLGSNAIGSVRLRFSINEPTIVTLTGSITSLLGPNVGTRVSTASAFVTLPGVGSFNTASHHGAFFASRTMLPGTYEIRGNATSSINGSASFAFNVALTPVPEPTSAVLMAAGLLALCRRHQAGQRAA